jgi:hypothetical protein
MTPGFAGFRFTKNPILHIPESDTMTKRDMQASEYAAESYEKTPAERGVSHMSGALTDEEREAIKTAVGGMCLWMKENQVTEDESLGRTCATLRSLLERMR